MQNLEKNRKAWVGPSRKFVWQRRCSLLFSTLMFNSLCL